MAQAALNIRPSAIVYTHCIYILALLFEDGDEENENEHNVEKEKPQRKRKASFAYTVQG